MLRWLPAILLSVTMLLLGSGTLSHLHDLAHQARDAQVCGSRRSGGLPPVHNENNCRIHALLQAPLLSGGAPTMIAGAPEVVHPTQVRAEPVHAQGVFAAIRSRGPPVL